MLRNLMIFSIISSLFGCGSKDSAPGMFSAMGYHIGKTKVWLKSPGSGMQLYIVGELEGADPATFKARTLVNKTGDSTTIGVDAHSAFWGYKKMDGADPATLELVAPPYSKDKNAAYYQHYRLSNDVAHFEAFGPFVRDAQNVYFAGEAQSDDAPHFVRVGDEKSSYFKDSKFCWYYISKIADADPATFRQIQGDFAVDARYVYSEMNRIDDAEVKSFQPLEHYYARDAHHAFFKNITIEGADPASFKVVNADFSLDARHCYLLGYTLPDADPKTFTLIDKYYVKDAKHVWINGKLIEGADPATFKVDDGPAGKSRDANHRYDLEKQI
ncbi:MAG: DKNYY domain-containing protein, partial [Bacteroidota bacterium]